MRKHLKKILTAALVVVLAFLIPATSVSAASATDWQMTYTRTVLENAIYYYANANYNLTFGTFEGTSDEFDRYYVWYDFRNLSAAQMEQYLSYGSKFGSVTTVDGNICDLMYQWWLPLGSESIAEDGYFTFYLGSILDRFSVVQDGRTFSFGAMFNYNAGSPAFTFQALNTDGYVDQLNDITFRIESYEQPIGTTMRPNGWPASDRIWQIKVVVECTNLSDYSALGIRFWTWDNTPGTVATNINPYMYLMIDPSDMWITEPGETTPETEAPGETVPPNITQDILDEITIVGSQLAQIQDSLIVPDVEASSDIAALESTFESQKEQFDTMIDEMQQVSLDFGGIESVIVDIGIGSTYNPYDDSWLKALFGGLWSNKFILHMVVLATGMAMFGFVLYGKKA